MMDLKLLSKNVVPAGISIYREEYRNSSGQLIYSVNRSYRHDRIGTERFYDWDADVPIMTEYVKDPQWKRVLWVRHLKFIEGSWRSFDK